MIVLRVAVDRKEVALPELGVNVVDGTDVSENLLRGDFTQELMFALKVKDATLEELEKIRREVYREEKIRREVYREEKIRREVYREEKIRREVYREEKIRREVYKSWKRQDGKFIERK